MSRTSPSPLDYSDDNVRSSRNTTLATKPGKIGSKRNDHDVFQEQGNDENLTNGKPTKDASGSSRRVSSGPAEHLGRFASLKRKMTRKRQSGGFLLDPSTVGAAQATFAPDNLHIESPQKGKRRAVTGDAEAKHRVSRLSDEPVATARFSPQSSPYVPYNSSHAETSNGYTEIGEDKTRNTATPASSKAGPSTLGSSLFEKSPRQTSDGKAYRMSQEGPRNASNNIDPTQLVRMALNLSESRRMHLDPGRLPSIPMPAERRIVSVASTARRSYLTSSTIDQRHSQARSSTHSSSGRTTPLSGEELALKAPLSSSPAESDIIISEPPPEYIFSPATLSRTQTAKTYIELSHQYRRLLQSLPPLRPRPVSTASQNPRLGRQYNTLQYLRNRDTRSDHKAISSPKSHGWNKPEQVTPWVDAVGDEAGQPGYIDEDIALLPQWSSGIAWSTNPDSEGAKTGHLKDDQKKDRRLPRDDWSVEPSDLLADAYWLEQDDHKELIVSRRGHKIFDTFHPPLRVRKKSTRQNQSPMAEIETRDFGSPRSARARASTAGTSTGTDRETDTETEIPMGPGQSRTARVRRTLLGRNRAQTLSSEDLSDDERRVKSRTRERSRVPKPNIGPLEKHMQAMIDQDSQNESSTDFSPTSPRLANEGQRRAGFSEQSANGMARIVSDHDKEEHYLPPPRSPSDSPPKTPRISVENYDRRDDAGSDEEAQHVSRSSTAAHQPKEATQVLNRASRLGFFRRHKPKESGSGEHPKSVASVQDNSKVETMTNGSRNNADADRKEPSAGRRSLEGPARGKAAVTNPEGRTAGTSAASKRFFRGGRIGEIVRTEANQASDVVFKRQIPRNASRSASRDGSASEADDPKPKSRGPSPKRRPAQLLPPSPGRRRRSSSTNDLKALGKQQYHIKNLPSFLPSNSTTPHERSPSVSSGPDHISRQLREKRLQRKQSRLNALAPPRLDTESDVSPTTSSPDLTRQTTRESYGFPSGKKSAFGTLSGAQLSGKRLNDRLSPPGAMGPGDRGRPPTGLSSYDPKRDPSARPPALGPRHWSSARMRVKPHLAISEQDVALVRSQLLSSGVKAQAIVRHANAPRQQPPAYLQKAFEVAGESLFSFGSISRRQEHIVAAKALSNRLSSTLSAIDASVVHFRNDTCNGLNARIDDLRDRATSTLMPRLRSIGDDADGFVARLTTTHTLAIKQVNDSVDLMLRKRRRRLRYFQQGAFTVLEWTLVGIMWLIWAFVLALKALRGMIWILIWGAKWLFWVT